MNAITDTSTEADSTGVASDDPPISTVARLLGLSPEEIREALDSAPDHYSPQCLKFYEFDSYDSLPEERRAHADRCASCSEVIAAMNIAPRKETTAQLRDLVYAAADISPFGAGGPVLISAAEGMRAVNPASLCSDCRERIGDHSDHEPDLFDDLLEHVGLDATALAKIREFGIEKCIVRAEEYLAASGRGVKRYAQDNPGKVTAGVAVLALGAGLLLGALRDRES
jgi:hypothetical protein